MPTKYFETYFTMIIKPTKTYKNLQKPKKKKPTKAYKNPRSLTKILHNLQMQVFPCHNFILYVTLAISLKYVSYLP